MIQTFLKLAIEIVQAVSCIHSSSIIHKDINPSNILVSVGLDSVKIIDFQLATLLSREDVSSISLNALEGTLPYLSPEQTGRVNRSVDYRSDFYSLGVTFYEMLTGALPFNADDSFEIIHSHIARMPRKPS